MCVHLLVPSLRETCSKVIKNFPEVAADNKRAEFLPVEWRSSLKLDGGTFGLLTLIKLPYFQGLYKCKKINKYPPVIFTRMIGMR